VELLEKALGSEDEGEFFARIAAQYASLHRKSNIDALFKRKLVRPMTDITQTHIGMQSSYTGVGGARQTGYDRDVRADGEAAADR
jgi:hypothetical protein